MGARIRGCCDQLIRVTEFAKGLGFDSELTRGGHVCFKKPGKQPVFFSQTPRCPRAWKNGISNLKKSDAGQLLKV
jgi:hypothetical protein